MNKIEIEEKLDRGWVIELISNGYTTYDIVNEYEDIDANIVIYDPWANPIDVKKQYNRISINKLKNTHINFDVIILCVSHNEFKKINLNKITSKNSIIYDIKGFYSNKVVDSFL